MEIKLEEETRTGSALPLYIFSLSILLLHLSTPIDSSSTYNNMS